jgi:uncharacterized FAD-dependent dehydrogenase
MIKLIDLLKEINNNGVEFIWETKVEKIDFETGEVILED